MWELVVPIYLCCAPLEHPQQWRIPQFTDARTVTLGPFASRQDCQTYRLWLVERADHIWYYDEAGNEPIGYDPAWVFANLREVGYCQTVDPHSSK